jgi:hypothetical protein
MNFNLRHNVELTNQIPQVNNLKKSSNLFFQQNKFDDFCLSNKTPKTNYIIILNNSIFSKNGDSVWWLRSNPIC